MVTMEESRKDPKKPIKSNGGGLNDYARYSGMAFEMVAIILAGVFGGTKLDELADTKPLFTVVLSLISVTAAIYIVIRDLLKRKK